MSPSRDDPPPLDEPDTAAGGGDVALPPPPTVLLVDIEPGLAALLGEWLGEAGIAVLALRDDELAAWPGRIDLIAVDLPFPRQRGAARVQQLVEARPGTPLLALSPTFFAGVAARGEVARQLGVAAVLATPVGRVDWLAAVGRLLGPRR